MPVLLVEDNFIIGNALRDHIAADGWSVDWSVDLRSAIFATDHRSYTLILLDLHLPDGSGLELLRRLNERLSMPPVIILSAYDQLSDRLEGIKLGAADYLVKPFDLMEMIARIDRVMGRPVYVQRAARSA
ncbi:MULTISPECIES: response regulator [Rhizobium]|uniref:Response regulator n=1 Tax=Rhizobium rhododendri TaxID=2506430 RepID=A0ABY8IRV2_9HYPH|nr:MULTISPECIES: response regulator [Rhizobium]TQX84259.1 response regulator transcription factor [Rhizobium sp. rho-13.1]TQY07818.1 response regulator transcription factor [Rhizobium sp. rho-1.1]WFS26319.1 response regulator [Rhizobium rhododendri]